MRRKSQFPGEKPAIMKRRITNFQKLDQRTPYRIYFNILFQNVKHKCTNLFARYTQFLQNWTKQTRWQRTGVHVKIIRYVDQAAAPPRVPPRVKIRGICGCGGIGRLIGFRFQRASVQVRVLSSAPIIKAPLMGCFYYLCRQDENPLNADVQWTSAHSRLDGNDTLIPSSPVIRAIPLWNHRYLVP